MASCRLIVERPTTEQSHDELARNFGSRQTLSTHGHRRANISAQEPRDSRPGGRWAHPPSTGGDLTNSRVRSTHPFHTKLPFSRFGGGRRQKSENTIMSARGRRRRRPQAPTLRLCALRGARTREITIINRVRSMPRAGWRATALWRTATPY